MLKKPTADQFAFGAMLFGFMLVGIVIGVWIGGHNNVRGWIGALSGWVAAAAALGAALPTLAAVRRQIRLQKLLHEKDEISVGMLNASEQATALQKIVYAIEHVSREIEKGPQFSDEGSMAAFRKNAGGANGLYAISSRVQIVDQIFRDSVQQLSEQVASMMDAANKPTHTEEFVEEVRLTRQLLSGMKPHIEQWAAQKAAERDAWLKRSEENEWNLNNLE
ncbi:hypothetical protein [Roseibium sp.]|uniref:hypothetical protein n=1 Tax=Roseibium sp. TaxID=1936156 RepID=UPI00326505CE